MAKNAFPTTRGSDSYYARSTIRAPLKSSAPARAVPPSVKPLKATYSKMDTQPSLFGGFGDTGLEETPSILGMSKGAGQSKGSKLIKSQLR